MYCVKCGVRLQDGVNSCPLCNTPVWNPEQPEQEQPREPFLRQREPPTGDMAYPTT